MERELLKFGGGVADSVVHPGVLLIILIAGLVICFGPRGKALTAFLLAAILIPMDQVLVVGSLHFTMLRVLILFGLIRMLRTKSTSKERLISWGMNKIDYALILLMLVTAVNWMLLWQQTSTLIFQLGEIYTAFGAYFLLRSLIRDQADIEHTIGLFAIIAAVVAVVMVNEQISGWNPYALLNGAQSSFFASAMVRDDRFRATGCFLHPILAGSFAAVLLPLFVGLWWTGRKHRAKAILGIIACTAMVLASNSSTPVMAYAAGILGLCLWPIRNFMRPIRWGIVLSLVSLHMVMKAPVWHLISRIDIVGGSSSDHRYQLVNKFILNFSQWWLIGVKDNGQWGWDMWDTANQYVATGQTSGLLPFILFVAIIVFGFKYVGRTRRHRGNTRVGARFAWALGAALFAHAVAFFGITYFDQTVVGWYALLAIISVSAGMVLNQEHRVAEPAENLEWDTSIPQNTPEPVFNSSSIAHTV